jgi:hypothetical protein
VPELDGQKGGDTPDPILQNIIKQQEAMGAVIANIGQTLQGLTGTMNSMQETFKGVLNVNTQRQEEPEIDFSTADMGSVAQFILKEVGKMVGTVKDDFSKQISDIRTDNVRSSRTNEFKEVASTKGNEDINEWLPEMRQLATTNPNLSIQQLLNLARLENPTKKGELQAKMDADQQANQPEKPDDTFGGLTPTSSRADHTTKGGEKKKVSVDDALKSAWDKVVPGGMKQEASSHDPIF